MESYCHRFFNEHESYVIEKIVRHFGRTFGSDG